MLVRHMHRAQCHAKSIPRPTLTVKAFKICTNPCRPCWHAFYGQTRKFFCIAPLVKYVT